MPLSPTWIASVLLPAIGMFAALAVGPGCARRPPLPAPASPLVATEAASFRAQRPPPLVETAPPLASVPDVATATLENGLSIWAVRRPRLPSIALGLVVKDAGTLTGPVSAEVMTLTARVVAEGGTIWSDGRVVDAPAVNGRTVAFRVLPSHTRFFLPVLAPALPAAIEVLARTVLHPAFAPDALDFMRLAALREHQERSNDISYLLTRMALEHGYGPELASRLLVADEQAVRRLGVKELTDCQRQVLRPERAALIAVGDRPRAVLHCGLTADRRRLPLPGDGPRPRADCHTAQ